VPDALPAWTFATSAPTIESRLEVTYPAGWEVRVALGHGSVVDRGAAPERRDRGDGQLTISVVEHNVAAVPTEPDAVDPQRLSPWAAVVLASATVGGKVLPYADSWKTVAARVAGAVAATVAIDGTAKTEIGRGLAKARLRNVRLRLKPALVREGILDRPPRSFAELARGGASPLEAAAVGAAATAASMEPGILTLVAPLEGPLLVDDLPGLYAFRMAVVAFKIDGKWVFADPSCSSCEFGKVSMEAAGGRALILGETPTLVDIPASSVEPNRRRLQFEWALSVDGALSGRLLADLDGFAARAVMLAAPPSMAEADRRAAIARALFGDDSGVSLDAIEREGDFVEGQTYSMRFKVSARAKSAGDGSLTVTSRLLAGRSLPQVLKATRRTDMLLPAPLRVEVTSSLELPEGFSAAIPAAVEERVSVGEYSARFSALRGQVMTFSRRLGLNARSVPAAHYQELAQFAGRMTAADAAVVSIKGD